MSDYSSLVLSPVTKREQTDGIIRFKSRAELRAEFFIGRRQKMREREAVAKYVEIYFKVCTLCYAIIICQFLVQLVLSQVTSLCWSQGIS